MMSDRRSCSFIVRFLIYELIAKKIHNLQQPTIISSNQFTCLDTATGDNEPNTAIFNIEQ